MVACLEVPACPLQLLLRHKPEWQDPALPVVVVDEDKPEGRVLWANAAARAGAVGPGERYATALAICRGLRAGVVAPQVIGAGVARLVMLLRRFTPNLEPAEDEPGTFWLDASGLMPLYPTLGAWAEAVLAALGGEGFAAMIAVGFTRFGTYATAKSMGCERRVFASRAEEWRVAGAVPLTRLTFPTLVRERLDRLGIRTVGELTALPPAGLLKRYGVEAYRLHRMARGAEGNGLAPVLTPLIQREPARVRELLDFMEHDAHRLLFRVKSLLDPLLVRIAERQTVACELVLDLGFEGRTVRERTEIVRHRFRPAAPTADPALLLDLVRLRLEGVDLRRGVVEVRLHVVEVPASPEQVRLFREGPRQDVAAAARALARVRAELGDAAVGRFVLREGHLPKAQAMFAPCETLAAPAPTPESERTPRLIRRIHAAARPIPPKPREMRNDGWPSGDAKQGPIVREHGPYLVNGGWWQGEIQREYAYAETQRGDALWIYYDRRRRRWFEEGRIE